MRRFLLAAALVPIVLRAQTPAETRLQPSNARLGEEFSDLVTMRELSDGRVLLFDRGEERLAVVDFATGGITNISRQGRGPGEYGTIVAIHALGGDSTLADDMERWLILDGAKVVATLPPDTPAIRAVHLWTLGADRRGHVLTRRYPPRDAESLYVALVDRATGRSDTLARLRAAALRGRSVVTRDAAGNLTGSGAYRVPLNSAEAAVLSPDGWVAIARLDPYRVDWRAPDGLWTRGAPLPFRAVRMNDREKRAFAARNRWAEHAPVWPENLPPFDSPTRLLTAPEGSVLIHRVPTADHPETRYDIVDRRGALQAQLVLPLDQRILGFGARSVYVITTDDDGIQRLQRHPWPPAS